MRKVLLILLPALLLAGCSKDLAEDISTVDGYWKDDMGNDDDPIVFPTESGLVNWEDIDDLNLRLKICRVPLTILKGKTTTALGLSILHYPMNYLILAYNYYDIPVALVYERSPLHMELAARKDAADALTGVFEKTSIDKDPGLVFAKSYEQITICDELFLEYFLGSGLIKGLDTGSNQKRLKAAVTRKRDERLADEDLNGALTLIPLAYMSERLGLGVKFSDDIVDTMHQFIQGD